MKILINILSLIKKKKKRITIKSSNNIGTNNQLQYVNCCDSVNWLYILPTYSYFNKFYCSSLSGQSLYKKKRYVHENESMAVIKKFAGSFSFS